MTLLHTILSAHLEVDEGESLRLASVLILGQEDAADVTERPEQILQILLPSVLRQVGHTHCCSLIWKQPQNSLRSAKFDPCTQCNNCNSVQQCHL